MKTWLRWGVVLSGGGLWADLVLPGAWGRTALGVWGETSVAVQPVSITSVWGSKSSQSFLASDFRVGLECALWRNFTLLASYPLYLDRVDSWAFGRGDLLVGLGFRAEPWPEVYAAFYPFFTAPTGSGYSADSLRAFTTQGFDYGVLASLTFPRPRWLLSFNLSLYNPNQAPGFGSHTNQMLWRALYAKRLGLTWLGLELSGEWHFVNAIVPEVSYIAGGSPVRLSGLARRELGRWSLELNAGVYLTKRQVLRNDSLVYPEPVYTLPTGNMTWELGAKAAWGYGISKPKDEGKKSGHGAIAGRVLYSDSTPAAVRVEVLELGTATVSDSSGEFIIPEIPPDTYTVYVSGKSISSLEPLKVVVPPAETAKLFLTVQRAEPCYVTVELRDIITSKRLEGLAMVEGISSDGLSSPKVFQVKEKAEFPLPPGAYVITGKADGYFAQSISITAAEGKRVEVVIDLMPKGYTIEFPGVFFDFGSAKIKPEAYPVLDSIGRIIRNTFALNKNLKIEVGGYTDDVGSLEANLKLSEARAKAVADFLIKNYGIDPEKILIKGYGPAHPKAPNTTEEGRAANRRVEIRFLEVL